MKHSLLFAVIFILLSGAGMAEKAVPELGTARKIATQSSIEAGYTYATALPEAGKQVVCEETRSGGHYQSMIDAGIAKGIGFFLSNK